jgi:hypothetical protein
MTGEAIRTAVSSVQVTVRQGIFTDRGIVIGKVFYDENENGWQDDGEDGIPRVELSMEDGTRILTGDDGKYSLPEVQPGQHVLRVNKRTLPTGSGLCSSRSEFAGDGETRFIRLPDGGIARADFSVTPPRQASLYNAFSKTTLLSVGEKIEVTYTIVLYDPGKAAVVSLVDTLPPGFHFELKSILLNDSTISGEGDNPAALQVKLGRRDPNSFHILKVPIHGDSAAIGRQIAHRGRLILSYPTGRDAVFEAKSISHGLPVSQESISRPATNEVGVSQSYKRSLNRVQSDTSIDPAGKPTGAP